MTPQHKQKMCERLLLNIDAFSNFSKYSDRYTSLCKHEVHLVTRQHYLFQKWSAIRFTHNWPVFLTSSTAAIISTLMSGFSLAISSPLAIKFSVAFCTAALKTWAFFDLPFFLFEGLFWFTNVVTYKRLSNSFYIKFTRWVWDFATLIWYLDEEDALS